MSDTTVGADGYLEALAAYRLPSSSYELPEDGWEQSLAAVATEGLGGLLLEAAAAGDTHLKDTESAWLANRVIEQIAMSLRNEATLRRVLRGVQRHGALVIKGPALAHGVHPDPNLRPFTDLDLVVPSTQFDAMTEYLSELGYRQSWPEPVKGFRHHVKAVALRHPEGQLIDLHRRLVSGAQGESVDMNDVFADPVTITTDDFSFPAPSWEVELVVSCLHLTEGEAHRPLLNLRDIATILDRDDLIVARVIDIVHRWGIAERVGMALELARRTLAIELPVAIEALVPATAAAMVKAGVPAGRHLAEVTRGPLRRRFAHLRAAVLPRRKFLRWKYGDQPTPTLYAKRWSDLATQVRNRGGEPAAAAAAVAAPLVHEPEPSAAADDWRSEPLAPVGAVRPPRHAPRVAEHLPPVDNPPVEPTPLAARPVQAPRHSMSVLPALVAIRDRRPRRGARIVIAVLVGVLTIWFAVASDLLGKDTTQSAPIVLLFFGAVTTFAIGWWLVQRHPDEPWLLRWLMVGFAVKAMASFLRYQVLVVGYESNGDAFAYHQAGSAIANNFVFGSPFPDIPTYTETNFIKYMTGWLYTAIGPSMSGGFLFYGLLAFWGSYFWYRAAVTAVPFINRKLLFLLLFLLPSVVFWPSSIGKESVMQFALGLIAFGSSLLLRRHLMKGLVVSLAGGWFVYMVRPHLLAMVALAVGVAYLLGTPLKAGRMPDTAIIGRVVGIIIIVLLAAFTVQKASTYLQLEDLSAASLETRLSEQSASSDQGGSKFNAPKPSLSPLALPIGFITVVLRPFPWEATSGLILLASLEGLFLTGLLIFRWRSLLTALRRCRKTPFLLYCFSLVALYSLTFSSFSNFGLLARERSLALPAVLVLVSVIPGVWTRKKSSLPPPSAAINVEDPKPVPVPA